jgi:hypothetical protein
MPPRKQPTRLEDLAIRQCSNGYIRRFQKWIRDLKDALHEGREDNMNASERVLIACNAMRAELSTKPPGVLKLLCPPLVAEFFKSIALHDHIAVHLYENLLFPQSHFSVCTAEYRCVFGRFIERFDTAHISNKFEKLILKNMDCVPELLELSLSYAYLGDQSELLATAIYHVKRLRIFKYPTHCTDEVIFQLRLHCPRLTEVDISHSVNVTNASAPHIIEFTELKWLNLEETRIDDEKYGFIISKLPNIANVIFWENEKSVLFHTGVVTLDTITNISGCFLDMEALSQMCPNTTNIKISSIFRDLSRLTAFNALRALDVDNLSYRNSNMNAVLTDTGHRLKDLTLSQCSDVNLQDIVTLCPSLVNLSLNWCSFLHFNSPFDSNLPHFRNLINLIVIKMLADPVDFRHIQYYSGLEAVHLFGVNIFTVEFVREIIRLGAFQQLAVFHLEEYRIATLTMEALQLLIRHCPLLKRIEGLAECPHFNSLLIKKLKRQILKRNFDLVIED